LGNEYIIKKSKVKPKIKKEDVIFKEEERSDSKQLNKIDEIIPVDEPCVMKCKKHNYTYQIIDGKMRKIEEGEVINNCQNVKFITVKNCEDHKKYLKQGKNITMQDSIKEL